MFNMKYIHHLLLSGLAAIVLLAGCSKEERTVTLGVKIDYNTDISKVYLDGNTPCWHNGDSVFINDDAIYTVTAAMGSNAQITGVIESEDGYRAIFPARLVQVRNLTSTNQVRINLPEEQEYELVGDKQLVNVPMGAYSETTTLTFHNLCSVLKVQLSNHTDEEVTFDRVVVHAENSYLSGSAIATVNGDANDVITMNSEGGDVSHDVTLFVEGRLPVPARETREVYIVCPPFDDDEVTISIHTLTHYASITYSDVSLGSNTINTVDLPFEELDEEYEGSIGGRFTINSNGDQICFSKGNLQWSPYDYHYTIDGMMPGTWRFAEHQYDFVGSPSQGSGYYSQGTVVGSDNAFIIYNDLVEDRWESTYNVWFDLFGWGTSGYYLCYPWLYHDNRGSTLIDHGEDYPYDDYGWDRDIAGTYYDWGVYNAISNGFDYPGMWRTLTVDEWVYLMQYRPDADHKRATSYIALPNGTFVTGMVLLPDRFTLPGGCSFGYEIGYSASDWEKMEAAGAVFLPAAGLRMPAEDDGIILEGFGRVLCYYTSTIYSTYYSDYISRSCMATFMTTMESPLTLESYYFNASLGCSVRLVRDVE